MSDGEDGNGTIEPDERTTLLSRVTTDASGKPYHENDNPMVRYPFKVLHMTWEILRKNYVNVLLVFVPLGIIAGLAGWNPTVVFTLNFFAIIPLASLLAFATEEVAVPLGQTVGGLLNATFGNAVELIVGGPLPALSAITNTFPGQHHCAAKWRNPHRPGVYARQHAIEYATGSWLLFHCRRSAKEGDDL